MMKCAHGFLNVDECQACWDYLTDVWYWYGEEKSGRLAKAMRPGFKNVPEKARESWFK